MGKILIAVVILGLVYFLFIRKSELLSTSKDNNANSKEDSNSDTMVECAKCKIFLSLDETILANGQHFCSKECANLN